MDVASTTTALIIAFTGANGNLNNHVSTSIKDVMHETPVVRLISGSAQTKLRADGLSVPFQAEDLRAIAGKISEKTGCKFDGEKPVRFPNTTSLEFSCPRR